MYELYNAKKMGLILLQKIMNKLKKFRKRNLSFACKAVHLFENVWNLF
jgi:hypothetical protein